MDYNVFELKLFVWTLLSVIALFGAFYMIWKVYKGLSK